MMWEYTMVGQMKFKMRKEVVDGALTMIYDVDQLWWYSDCMRRADDEKDVESMISFHLPKMGIMQEYIYIVGRSGVFKLYFADLKGTHQLVNYDYGFKKPQKDWKEYNGLFTTEHQPFLTARGPPSRIYRIDTGETIFEVHALLDVPDKRDCLDVWHAPYEGEKKHLVSIMDKGRVWTRISLEDRMRNPPRAVLAGRTYA